MPKVKFSTKFKKKYKKAPTKIKTAFNSNLKVFLKNPYNKQLNNHSLKGRYKMYRSINITGNWRAWYRSEGSVYFFTAIGTHSQLYK